MDCKYIYTTRLMAFKMSAILVWAFKDCVALRAIRHPRLDGPLRGTGHPLLVSTSVACDIVWDYYYDIIMDYKYLGCHPVRRTARNQGCHPVRRTGNNQAPAGLKKSRERVNHTSKEFYNIGSNRVSINHNY